MKLNGFKKIHWLCENAWVEGNGIPSSFAEKVHAGWRFDVIAFIQVADDMCASSLFFVGTLSFRSAMPYRACICSAALNKSMCCISNPKLRRKYAMLGNMSILLYTSSCGASRGRKFHKNYGTGKPHMLTTSLIQNLGNRNRMDKMI